MQDTINQAGKDVVEKVMIQLEGGPLNVNQVRVRQNKGHTIFNTKELKRNDKCFCKSGLKFKNCCISNTVGLKTDVDKAGE